jgi:hypothetical protein
MPNSISSSSQLATPIRYGCFLLWPIPGDEWIHEDDRFVAEHLIPGKRIFSCVDDVEGWNLYQYGRLSFRARPSMWTELAEPEFSLGEYVEVRSRMGKHRPLIAAIREVFWNRSKRRTEYQLSIAGRRLVRLYVSDELQLSAKIGSLPDHARRMGKLRNGGYFPVSFSDSESSENEELRLSFVETHVSDSSQ